MTMTPQDLLRKAADHIEKYGQSVGHWIPNEYTTATGFPAIPECPACAGGAMALVVTNGLDFSPNFVRRPSERHTLEEALELLTRHLGLNPLHDYGGNLDAVVEWSDSSTQEQVVAGLRAAAG